VHGIKVLSELGQRAAAHSMPAMLHAHFQSQPAYTAAHVNTAAHIVLQFLHTCTGVVPRERPSGPCVWCPRSLSGAGCAAST
jgi:hypothetical protein